MTEYPQRKQYRHPEKDRTNLPLRNVLNITFILLCLVAIACYFAFPQQRYIFTVIAIVAVLVKGVEVSIRIFANKNNANDQRRNYKA
jgi:membrane protein YdbS with pleckstrin-like domain